MNYMCVLVGDLSQGLCQIYAWLLRHNLKVGVCSKVYVLV